ncbi:hypothetical protein D3C72_1970040 [compost metagenome]
MGQKIVVGRRAMLEDEGGGAVVLAGLQSSSVQQGSRLDPASGVVGVHLLDKGAFAVFRRVDIGAGGLVGGVESGHFSVVG